MTTFLGPHSEADDHLDLLASLGHDVRIVGAAGAGTDKAGVLQAFATDLDLPDWFGHNWDALLDALRDLEVPRGQTLELVWDHVRALRRVDHDTYETVVDILEQVQDERDDVRVTVIAR
ncbi:MAG TPA: barstar family protein [Humibacillus xanthopallidus]|nr:barstar family protein [Humibacillus xanthopallidus]